MKKQASPIDTKKNILIVDDEADFGMLMIAFFEKKGYTVSVANTVDDGLKKLEENRTKLNNTKSPKTSTFFI